MVRAREILDAIIYELKESPSIPDALSYIDREPDIDTDAIKLPVLEVSLIDTTKDRDLTSDFVGFKKDDSGRDVGRVYHSSYLARIEISVWTAQGSRYDPEELSDRVRTVLYRFDTQVNNEPLVHPEKGELTEIWDFAVEDGSHTDDLTTTPPLRKWTERIEVYAIEEHSTFVPDDVKQVDSTVNDVDIELIE